MSGYVVRDTDNRARRWCKVPGSGYDSGRATRKECEAYVFETRSAAEHEQTYWSKGCTEVVETDRPPTRGTAIADAPQPATAPIVAGDIVRLKSGGPAMTVGTLGDERAHCAWFEGAHLHGGLFQLASLDRIGGSS